MSESLILRSSADSTQLSLSRIDQHTVLAQLRSTELQASAQLDGLAVIPFSEFFADLAENWRGWPGTKEWKNVEETLVLVASNDCHGHISLVVDLRSRLGERGWFVRSRIVLDAGQLDHVPAHGRGLFDAPWDAT